MVAALRRAQALVASVERVVAFLAALVVGVAATLSTAFKPTPPTPHPGDCAPPATLPPGRSGGGDAARGAVASSTALALETPALFFTFLGGMAASFSDVDFRSLLQRNSSLVPTVGANCRSV